MKPIIIYACIVLLTACSQKPVKPVLTKPSIAPIQIPKETPLPTPKTPNSVENKTHDYSLLKPSNWQDISFIFKDDLTQAWQAWLFSCDTLKHRTQWKQACEQAIMLNQPTNADITNYFTHYFDVFSAKNENGSDTGMITGYYEPKLRGSLTPSEQYPYPLYEAPNDLISVELSDLYPELKYKRIRGRLVGNKLIPYYTRAEIEVTPSPLSGHEVVWVDDIIDAFFLQIQGSGVVELENGDQLHVGYSNQNGHAYESIGKLLVERGELKLSEASMDGIKNWARSHLSELRELLNSNPSYVFFRALPKNLPGPLGALGVPLTAARSIAIDPKYIPLGAPVFLSTTYPNDNKPLNQLMMAQDTGGAIKNGVRADFYWGSGDTAGKLAGAMKQTGKIWVLLPKGFFN